MMYNNDPYLNDFENRIEAARQRENELEFAMQTSDSFDLQPPEGYESDDDSLGELSTNDSIEIEIEDFYFEDDGQPDEHTEWQDYMDGDEYYDHSENCLGDW